MNSFLQKIAKGKTSVIAACMLVMGLMIGVQGWGQTSTQNFGTGTGSQTSQTGSTSFLPNPTSGTTYTRAGATAPNAPIVLANTSNPLGTTGSYVRAVSSATGSVSKFSPWVSYTGGTEFYTSFKILFGDASAAATATSGVWTYFQGAGAMYSDVNDFTSAQVFTALRFTFGAGGALALTYRAGSTFVNTGLTSSSFSSATVYTVEIVANNKTSGTINYNYNGGAQSVAVQKFDLYINGTLIGDDLAEATLPANTSINAGTFIGTNSTSNVANIFVDDAITYNAVPASIGTSTTNYYLKSGGTVTTLADWGTSTDGTSGGPAPVLTSNNITWNIRNNTSVSNPAAWTLGTGSKIVTGDGTNATNFTIPSGFAITGTVDVAAAATLSIANTTNPTLGTLAATSTVAYTATAPQTVPAASYGNLSVSTTGGSATASGIITVANQLTVASGSTFNLSTNTLVGATLTTSGTGALQAGNTGTTPIPTGRTWSMDVAYNGGDGSTVVAGTYGNLDISGGNRTLINGGTIGISGTYTPGAGTLTVTGNTINFSSASAQSIPAATYNNITNTGNGNRTLASSGTITIGGTTFTPGTGLYTVTGSTVAFSSGTGLTIPALPPAATNNYNNLTISGSGSYSLAASITLGNNFNQSAGTFTVTPGSSAFSLTVGGNFSQTAGTFNVTGTVATAGATVNVAGSTSIFSMQMEANSANTASTVLFQANGDATFTGSSTTAAFDWMAGGNSGTIYDITFGIKGNFNWSNATGRPYTSGSGTAKGFVFNGTGTTGSPQTLTYSGSTTTLTSIWGMIFSINSGTVVRLLSGVAIGASADPYNTFTVNGSLDAQTFVVSGGSATVNAINTGFTLASGATLLTKNTGGIVSTVTTAIKNYTAGAKYEFNSTTAAQSTGFTGLTINTPNLITISNTFGAVTADANVTFGNTASLVINSSSILDANTRTFTFGTGGVVTVNGTIKTGNTTATGALSGSATSTIVSTNTPTLTLAGTSVVEFNGVAAQFAAARTFPNLTINNSNGVTMLGNVTVTTALALTNGALSIGANTLAANGVISRTSGVMNGTSSSILTLAGGSAQDLAFSTVSSLSLLNVNKSGGTATLNSGASDSLNIYTGIDFTGNTGTLNLNGKIVAFKSSVTKTAYVGTVAGTFSGATNVTVERYLSARRAWRFLSAPTSGSQTINAAWQEGQANTSYLYAANSNTKPGYGTHITGGAYTSGFDPTQNNASSLRFWSPSSVDGWSVTPPATNATQVNSSTHRAYAVFVRGSRNIDMNQGTLAVPDVTILRSTGSLNVGNLSRSYVAASGDFLLFDNPFVSPVLYTDLTKNQVNTNFLYMWDPYLGTTGAFQVISTADGSANTVGGSYTNPATNLIIQSGQAFMVRSTGTNPQINFLESAKRTNQVIVNKENADRAVTPRFSISLQVATDTSVTTLDGASVYFGKNFSAGVDVRDANKIANYNENLGLLRNGQDLAIETRPLINVTDTLYPHLYNIKIQGYRFEMIPTAMKAAPFTAVLEDAYLQTSTPVSLKVNTVIPFTIDNNPLSYAVTRFRIVFNPKTSVAGEVSSSDEVVAVDNNGTKSVSVYPNPVTGNDIKVAFNNQQAGKYSVTLYTVRGEKVFTQVVNHVGGSALVSLTMPSKPSAGLYQLQVADGKSKQVVKVVIQ